MSREKLVKPLFDIIDEAFEKLEAEDRVRIINNLRAIHDRKSSHEPGGAWYIPETMRSVKE